MSTTAAHATLAIYLRDHHAAGRAGVALARRAADGVGLEAPLRQELGVVAEAIAEDLVSLEEIMAQLGVDASRAKDTLASLGERMGRLKSNGRLRQRSPLSDVIELEALVAGIAAKEALWWSLSLSAALAEADDGPDLERLIERARHQTGVVERCRREAARVAFRDLGR